MIGPDEVVRSAVAVDRIESAVIFVAPLGGGFRTLAAAAGIEGPPLDGLVAAVANPANPIVRALADDGPTFDVRPMNPGGPPLRSHLPLIVERDGRRMAVGVLAVAHNEPLGVEARSALASLADAVARSLASRS